MTGVGPSTHDIVRLVRTHRFDLSDEKRTQVQLADVLTAQDIAFEREKRLAAGDIIDFLVEGGIGIEIKLRGQRKMAIFKQLQRYAAHDAVTALVLVTNVAMGLPAEIGGKPAYYATLSRGWL